MVGDVLTMSVLLEFGLYDRSNALFVAMYKCSCSHEAQVGCDCRTGVCMDQVISHNTSNVLDYTYGASKALLQHPTICLVVGTNLAGRRL